jgi:hypothetical protein
LTHKERRRVVESIPDKVAIGKGNEGTVEIDLAYLPSQANEHSECPSDPIPLEKAVKSPRNGRRS